MKRSQLRFLLLLAVALSVSITASAQTTVTGTVSDPNGNPYASGTASAIKVVPSGQSPGPPTNTITTTSGSFSMVLPSPASYVFTICAPPVNIGPRANPTPPLLCFASGPISISGGAQNISTTLNSVAPILGPSTGTGSLLPSTISLKPSLPLDPAQYVSANGNDGNDGLSWGTAKLTVYAALQALPGGSSTQVGTGTIYLSGTVNYGGPAANQGMWIMGGSDPNFGSPPLGWLKKSTSGPIDVRCAFVVGQAAHAHNPICVMAGGGITDLLHPAIWISGTTNINLENFGLSNFINTYIKLGIDSNNNRATGGGGSSSIRLDGIGWNHGNCRFGGGPGLDVGSNVFWVWLRNITGSGCAFGEVIIAAPGTPGLSRSSNVVTVITTTTNSISTGDIITTQNTTDTSFIGSFTATVIDGTHFTFPQVGPNATSGNGQVVTAAKAAINLDATGGSGSGLIFIDDVMLSGGGIRISPGNQGAGAYIHKGDYEGDTITPDMPTVLVTSSVATSNGTGMNIRIDDVEVSDPSTPIPAVRIDNTTIPAVVISRVDRGVIGPALVLGSTPSDPIISDLRAGRVGYDYFGRVVGGGIDVARRGFSPVAVVSPNIALTNPASWAFEVGAGTITGGIAAPDGTTGAGRITSNAGTSIVDLFISNNAPIVVGDTYIYGAWERSNSGGGLSGPVKFSLNANGFGTGDTCVTGTVYAMFTKVTGDGQWIWNGGLCKIFNNPTNAGLSLSAPVTNPAAMDIYGPVLIKIPSGTKSDNELYEIASNLSSYSAVAAIGEVSMLGTQRLRIGSDVFANLGTPANGVFVYCSDCTVANPCAGAGTGALAKRLNGVWVCN